MFKTPELFVARLTEVEKIAIRNADTQDRIDYLFHVRHAFEIDLEASEGLKMFHKARKLLLKTFAVESANPVFGNTWKF